MPLSRHTSELASDHVRQKQPVSIFAIIVIYKMRPDQSVTCRTLLESLRAVDAATLNVSIVIADNTPGGQESGALPSEVSYQAYPDNPGLVVPYNIALAQARDAGYDWLLTLDQDTDLPLDFFSALRESVESYSKVERLAAIVPRIVDNGRLISPLQFVGGFFPRVIDEQAEGVLARHTMALNSASLLRVSALTEVGGYDERFPLNNSDTALFHRLDNAGFRIALARNTIVQHELAIMRRADRMTLERYRQVLIDERNFWDLHMNFWARSERFLRLVGRLFKGLIKGEDAGFREATRNEIRLRLFTRRGTRLRNFQIRT